MPQSTMIQSAMPGLACGDPAPTLALPDGGSLCGLAGRPLVLSFLGSAASPPAARALATLDRTDLGGATVLVVSTDERDGERTGRGWGLLRDPAGRFSAAWGMVGTQGGLSPHTVVLDQRLRVWAVERLDDPVGHVAKVAAALRALPREDEGLSAPVLVVPRVFEPGFAHRMVQRFERRPPTRHAEWLVDEPDLLAEAEDRIVRRLLPEVERAFAFRAARTQRCLLVRTDAADQPRPVAPRPVAAAGAAEGVFAVSIALNAEAYEGGDLRLPEFGHRTYRAPTGGAVVFSAALVHEDLPVTRGRRYRLMPVIT